VLIITDLEDRVSNITKLITTLDRPELQVEIEARIVQTNRAHARALGIEWGFNGLVDPSLGNTTNLAFPNQGSLSGLTDLSAADATSVASLALGSVNGAFGLDMRLSAMEQRGEIRILSTPRVTTQNNVEAEIAQGQRIPFQTASPSPVPGGLPITTVTFEEAALTLRVTPQITAAGTVIMRISVDNGSLGAPVGTPPQNAINTQRANTTVLVRDGETTVIGGIYSSNERTTDDRTPGLSRIPLFGWFFRRDAVASDNSELLIFITPRIMQGALQ
jgi:type IV pilus assembly protein PilQ